MTSANRRLPGGATVPERTPKRESRKKKKGDVTAEAKGDDLDQRAAETGQEKRAKGWRRRAKFPDETGRSGFVGK